MAKVSVIILNWNGLKDTLECLDSVYKSSYSNFEILVIDNGSSDDSVEAIRREFPQVVLIENNKNLGYTGGNNIGMYHAMERGADYAWLLNNDTVIDPDTLSKLVDEAERSPEIGLVSPVIHYYDSPEKVQFMGAYLDFAKYLVMPVMNPKELDNEWLQRNLILYGTALFIKKSVIEAVGYLPEKYFAYHEDCDYSLRALRKNFRTSVLLDARILHKESRSTGKQSPIQVFLRTRNAYFLWRDNEQWFRKILVPGRFISMMIRSAKLISDEGNAGSYDACINGVWAAFRGRGGNYDQQAAIPLWFKTLFRFLVSWHPHFWISFFKGDVRGIVREALARVQIR